jgi:DCN1-like protein 1/2
MSIDARRQRQLVDQFVDFTQATSAVAKNFLKIARWDLEVAINEYLAYQAPTLNRRDQQSLLSLFDQYKEDDTKIGIDGTMKYIEDLGYEPEDRVILALAEFLESPSAGVFTKRSFQSKWQSVK